MDDAASSPGSTFHTPEQQQHHQSIPTRTPGTTTAAASTSLPVTTAKKRPAPSPDNNDGDDEPSQGILGTLLSTMTPSRWKRSRRSTSGRSSLDGMSGSAIKSAHRTPLGSDEGGSSGERAVGGGVSGGGGYQSDGIKSSGNKLEKLNLAKKFEAPSATNNGGAVPVQQATSPGMQQRVNGGAMAMQPARKRGRLSATPARKQPPAASGVAAANNAKSVRIGGHTNFGASSPYHAFAAKADAVAKATSTPIAKNTPRFNVGSAVKPKFNVGSAAKPRLRDIRGRAATPAGKLLGRRTAIATPGASRGARGGTTAAAATARGGLARTPGGTMVAGRKLASVRPSQRPGVTNAAARGPVLSRATGYRRRPLGGRFRPMSRLLTKAYTQNQSGGVTNKANQSTMLTDSIVSQILEENRNRLGLANNNGHEERALFGGNVARGNSEAERARTFEEEAQAYKAVGNAPRVRMNRVLGTGQSGGQRWTVGNQLPMSTTTTAVSTVAAPAPAIATAPAPAPSLLFGRPSAPAASTTAPAPSTGASFFSPIRKSDAKTKEAEAIPAKPFVPYAAATLQPRGTDPNLKLTPCKPTQENVAEEVGEEYEKLVATQEWRKEAMGMDFGFGDPKVNTPCKSARKKGKVGKSAMKKMLGSGDEPTVVGMAAAAEAGGAPYSFMPGGAAASSKVSTPAYKFGDDKSKSDALSSASKTPAKSPTPKSPAPASPAPNGSATKKPIPAGSGWGNLFKAPEGEWKCDVCLTKNPKEAGQCLACETPKAGGGGSSDKSSSGGGAATNGSKAAPGSIGAGGFSFGGSSSSEAASSSAGGNIGAGGFSFGGAPSSSSKTTSSSSAAQTPSQAAAASFQLKEGEWKCKKCYFKNGKGDSKCGSCGAEKDDGNAGSTPAKAKRGRDDSAGDSKVSIGAGGFSFGGATSTAAPAASTGNGGAGFSFGGAAPANTPSKSKRGRDDKDESSTPVPSTGGFAFGGAAPPSTNKASTSGAGFSFGGGDEKKEDPAPASGKGGASIPGFAFGSAPPASAKKDEAASSEPSAKKTMFSFGKGGSTPSLPMPAGNGAAPAAPGTAGFSFGGTPAPAPAAPAPAFGSFGSTPAAAEKTDAAASSSFFGAPAGGAAPAAAAPMFGSTPAPKPAESAAPAGAAFAFGSTPAPAPSTAGGSTAFAFGGAASSSTPAPPAQPPSGAGFSFGAGASTPAAPAAGGFGATPAPAPIGFGAAPAPAAGGFGAAPAPAPGGFGGFGSASQPAPAPATPGTSFAFGGAAPAAPSAGGFGAAPAPAAGGFGFGNASQPPAAAPVTPAFGGFGGTPAAPTNPTPGFAAATPAPAFGAGAGGFGAPPAAAPPSGGFGGTPAAAPAAGGFSIGTGGAKPRRRIIKARRPPGGAR